MASAFSAIFALARPVSRATKISPLPAFRFSSIRASLERGDIRARALSGRRLSTASASDGFRFGHAAERRRRARFIAAQLGFISAVARRRAEAAQRRPSGIAGFAPHSASFRPAGSERRLSRCVGVGRTFSAYSRAVLLMMGRQASAATARDARMALRRVAPFSRIRGDSFHCARRRAWPEDGTKRLWAIAGKHDAQRDFTARERFLRPSAGQTYDRIIIRDAARLKARSSGFPFPAGAAYIFRSRRCDFI